MVMSEGADMTEWTMIGVPTAAGAHHAGQDQAPAALRKAGLVDRLQAAGVSVTDAGDLPGASFAVDREHPDARNVPAVVRVAREVADAVSDVVRDGGKPLVVGGDCTITVGVVTGVRRVHPGVGLAYVDGDVDLGSGGDSTGIMDASGIAHMLGLRTTELASLDGPPPLLQPSRLALIGADPHESTAEQRQFIADAGISLTLAAEFNADPESAARRALAALAGPDGARAPVVVHFDIDVVDSGDLPLGNFPHYGSGVVFERAIRGVRALLADPACAAVVLTEVNPTYDPDGSLLDRYTAGIASAFAG
jgi:arginase